MNIIPECFWCTKPVECIPGKTKVVDTIIPNTVWAVHDECTVAMKESVKPA